MAILTTEAIVLRVMDYSETSLIAWLFTRDHGRVHVLAKGARRPRSVFEGALEPLVRGELVFYRKKQASDGLETAKEFDPTERHRGLRSSLTRMNRGLYLAELLGELTERGEVNPGAFDAASRGLLDVSEGEATHLTAALFRAELALLASAGLAPSLRACVRCGAEDQAPKGFSAPAGGALCATHAQGDPTARPLSAGAHKTLAALAEGQILAIGRDVHDAIRDLLDRFITYHLGKQLRLQPWLRGEGRGARPAREIRRRSAGRREVRRG